MQQFENKLNEFLVTKAPFQIPENGRAAIVKVMPWLTLIGGLLSLWGVWVLYRLATVVDSLTNYYNSFGYAYAPATHTVSPLVWLGIVVLLVEAIMFIIAFPALKERKKSGWNLLFYTGLLNVVYAIINLVALMDFGSFIMSLISSLVGMYLLFQVRAHFIGVSALKTSAPKPTATPPSSDVSPKE